jgi:hypothetical protein
MSLLLLLLLLASTIILQVAAGFVNNLKSIRFADKRQLVGEGLSIFIAQDCLEIFRSSSDVDFPGWLTLPTMSDVEGLSTLLTAGSIYAATWIGVGALALNCYAVTLPYRPRSNGDIWDLTNAQFLSFCNVFLTFTIINILITHDHIDLATAQTRLGLIYASILGFRVIYANI